MALTVRSRLATRRLLDAVRSPEGPDTAATLLRAAGLGMLAAVVGLVLSMVLTVASWAAVAHAPGAAVETPIRLAAALWLLAQHVPLSVAGGTLSATPLGWTALVIGLLYLAGKQAARSLQPTTFRAAGVITASLAVGYGLAAAGIAGTVSATSPAGAPHAHLVTTFWICGLLAAIAGGGPVLRTADLAEPAWLQIPHELRQSILAGIAALGVVLAASAALVVVGLVTGFSDSLEYARVLGADGVGGASLALVSLGVAPNLVVWAAAFAAGPGFGVGLGAHVSPQAVTYSALPVFPPLSALPPAGAGGGAWLLVLIVPLAAGGLAGWLVYRGLAAVSPGRTAAWALAAGAVAGSGYAVLAAFSAGSLGDGRLSEVGAGALAALALATEVGLIAAIVAWECQRRWPRLPSS